MLYQSYHQNNLNLFSISFLDGDKNESEKAIMEVKYIDRTKPVIDSFELKLSFGKVLIRVSSKSKDKKRMVIKRKSESDFNFKTIYSNIFMNKYYDLRMDKGNAYKYKILLFDGSGNYSVSESKSVRIK